MLMITLAFVISASLSCASTIVGVSSVRRLIATNGAGIELVPTSAGVPSRSLDLQSVAGRNGTSIAVGSIAVGEAGNDVFWTDSGINVHGRPDSVVETPIDGGRSRILGYGVKALPSPDGQYLLIQPNGGSAALTLLNLRSGTAVNIASGVATRDYINSLTWLAGTHVILAVASGQYGCGPTSCTSPRQSVLAQGWTVNADDPSAGWSALSRQDAARLDDLAVLGAGSGPSTFVAAQVSGGKETAQVLTIRVAQHLTTVQRVNLSLAPDAVDHTGSRFLCFTAQGFLATEAFSDPEARPIDTSNIRFERVAWW